jgi:hypothetical protein
MDEFVRPYNDQCTVLSFGINHDESFDLEMNNNYGCHVHSFDPDVIAPRFKTLRAAQGSNSDMSVEVNKKWHFYSLGLTAVPIPNNRNLLTIEQIYDLTGTRNKVIDIWKMDIEGNERAVFENLDMDYVCKYVKQFMFETHWVSLIFLFRLYRVLLL